MAKGTHSFSILNLIITDENYFILVTLQAIFFTDASYF